MSTVPFPRALACRQQQDIIWLARLRFPSDVRHIRAHWPPGVDAAIAAYARHRG
jgi:hypothetical protein